LAEQAKKNPKADDPGKLRLPDESELDRIEVEQETWPFFGNECVENSV
jgi:hypothetical protein